MVGLAWVLQVHAELPPARKERRADSGDPCVAFPVRAAILSAMPKKPPTATQADTIAALLDRSKRAEVPIRKTFG